MTNLEIIRQMPDEYFARMAIYYMKEPIYDEDFDGKLVECGSIDTYTSIYDDMKFGTYNETLDHNIEWLHREAE